MNFDPTSIIASFSLLSSSGVCVGNMATSAGKIYTMEEVAQHNSVSAGVWVVINGCVYDVTQFVDEHPGGEEVLLDNAGKDATSAFTDVGHSNDAIELREGFLIGRVASTEPSPETTPPSEERKPIPTQIKTAASVAASLLVPVVVVVGVAIGAYLIYRRYKK